MTESERSCAVVVGATGLLGSVILQRLRAAGLPPAGPVDTADPDILGAGVALKVGGLMRLVRAAEDRLGTGSRVVALGGHCGSEPAPYASLAGITNAALANAVRQLAIAHGPRGITVHLVAPGPVNSIRLHRLLAGQAERLGVPASVARSDEIAARREAASPNPRGLGTGRRRHLLRRRLLLRIRCLAGRVDGYGIRAAPTVWTKIMSVSGSVRLYPGRSRS